MGDFNKIAIRDFQLGLFTDPDSKDLAPGAASQAQNCDLSSFGKLKKSRGAKAMTLNSTSLPAYPSGFVDDGFKVFHNTEISDKDVIVVSGTQAGRRRFYITPWYDGSWHQDSWLELTEVLSATVASTASSTSLVLTTPDLQSAAISSTDDYYNKWYIHVWDVSGGASLGWSLVKDYVGSTRTITLKYALTSMAAGDIVTLSRFPVFAYSTGATLNPHFTVDSQPQFAEHGERIYIYTGNNHKPENGPDLWLGFLNRQNANSSGYFNDADLDFVGWHFDHLHLFKPNSGSSGTGWNVGISEQAESNDPLLWQSDIPYYIFAATTLYDGFQESNFYFSEGTTFDDRVTLTDASRKARISLSILPMLFSAKQSEWASSASNAPPVLSRRIERLLIYAARAGGNSLTPRAKTPFFMVKDLPIDSASWAGSGPYTQTLDITLKEWDFGQKRELSLNLGHDIERISAVAKQGLQVGGNWVSGPYYANNKYPDAVLVAPISSFVVGGTSMPAIMAKSLSVQTREAGIYEIVALIEQQGRLLIFGKNTFAVALIQSRDSQIIEQFQKRGLASKNGVQVLNNVVYYAGVDSLYAYDGSAVRDIGDRIKSDWSSISLAHREACFTGVSQRLKQFYVLAGSTLFVWNVLQQNWKTETLDFTWTSFGAGVSGELFGSNGSALYQLDASSYTSSRALSWKSHRINTMRVRPRRFRMSYQTSDLLTIKLYDASLSTSVPRQTLYAPSTMKKLNVPVSFESNEVLIEVASASSTNDDLEISEIELAHRSLEES